MGVWIPVGNGLLNKFGSGVRPPSLLVIMPVLLLKPLVISQSLFGLTMYIP